MPKPKKLLHVTYYSYKILSLQYPNSKSKYTYGDDTSKYIGLHSIHLASSSFEKGV